MRRDRLTLGIRVLGLLGGCAAVASVVRGVAVSGDYRIHGAVMGDNAGPAINALVHGRLADMASHQPLMGLVSLVWRAPFAGVAVWLGGSDQLGYQLGVAACLLSIVGLLVWLSGRVQSLIELGAAVVAAAVILAGPGTTQAVRFGHPEEVLATALAAGAVIAAGQNRRRWAAALLGLAIGTKPWAVLAMPCVLLALPGARGVLASRVSVATGAIAIAAPAVTVLPLVDMTAFRRAEHLIGGLNVTTPFSVWWPMRGSALGGRGVPMNLLPLSLTRAQAAAWVLGLAFAAIWIYGRRVGRGRVPAVDALASLALVGLLRCLADPSPVTYYFVPVVVPLALWEAGTLGRLPIAAVLTTAMLDLFPRDETAVVAGRSPFGLTMVDLVWISAWAVLGIYLAWCVFHADAKAPRPARATLAVQPATEPS